jgi:hypothetical protein
MAHIHYHFEQHIGQGTLIPLPEASPDRDLFISSANRIARVQPVGSIEPHIPFTRHEDPSGVLTAAIAASPNIIRSKDLKVKYMDARSWVSSQDP